MPLPINSDLEYRITRQYSNKDNGEICYDDDQIIAMSFTTLKNKMLTYFILSID